MNRSERRKMAKQMTPKNIEQVVEKAVYEAIQKERKAEQYEAAERLHIWIVMTAYVINYKLGLGRKRLPQLMNDIMFNIDCFRTGHLAKEDYQIIKEEMKKLGVDVDK